jgi:hypothetical protein
MSDYKILILHGQDASVSRNLLTDEKRKNEASEIITLDANKIQLTDLVMANEAVSILSDNKMLVIEGIFTGRMTAEKEKFIEYLNNEKLAFPTVLYEWKAIDKKVLIKYFPNARIVASNYPPVLFKFLDSIGSATALSFVKLFHEVLKEKDAEFIYIMLIRQFRLLIIASDSGISGLSMMQPWQAGKFVTQSGCFKTERWISLYRLLLSIDVRIKTGITPYSYTQLLDIFLFTL